MAFSKEHYFCVSWSNDCSEGKKGFHPDSYETLEEAKDAFLRCSAKYVWLSEQGKYTDSAGELKEDWIVFEIKKEKIFERSPDGHGWPNDLFWSFSRYYKYTPSYNKFEA
jgi:hypothetical protein